MIRSSLYYLGSVNGSVAIVVETNSHKIPYKLALDMILSRLALREGSVFLRREATVRTRPGIKSSRWHKDSRELTVILWVILT